MTNKAAKIMMYAGMVIASLATTIAMVIGTQMSFYSSETMPWQEMSLLWLAGVPLAAGVLTVALLFALSLLAAPVLACVWLINELTRRNSHNRVITAPFLSYHRSVDTLKPSGNIHRVGSSIADPEGGIVSLE